MSGFYKTSQVKCLHSSDPTNAWILFKIPDLAVCQHFTIRNKYHARQSESVPDLNSLISHRCRITGVAWVGAHSNRSAITPYAMQGIPFFLPFLSRANVAGEHVLP